MVKRRGERIFPESKRKRFERTSLITTNQENCILNDGLLNLYKKAAIEKENALKEKDSSLEKQVELESLKTPSRRQEKRKEKLRKRSLAPVASLSKINFEDVGVMMEETLEEILDMFHHHHLAPVLEGIEPTRGILLHGPPGCGKTHLAKAIAGELQLPILEVDALELENDNSEESEGMIQVAFETAIASGRCILFIDNIHSICLKKPDNVTTHRIGRQLMKCFDELSTKDVEGRMMVVGATNQLDAMKPELRARFTEVAIGMPDKDGRQRILKILYKQVKLSPEFSLSWLAKSTPGYVAGDFKNLVKIASKIGIKRLCGSTLPKQDKGDSQPEPVESPVSKPPDLEILHEIRENQRRLQNLPQEVLENFYYTEEDFKKALQKYVPFSKKEGFASVDKVTWDDVGGLADVKEQLQRIIVRPIKYKKFYEANNMRTPKGMLLFGPKGCGKTLVAKAIANECNLNFLSVKGSELLNKYVGESEQAIKNTFEKAQNCSPCVIFFDEFDALCPPRSYDKDNAPVDRVVNQLLCASDGTCSREQVIMVAATNRLDKIDSAMLRPGRLERVYYIGLPTPDERVDILKSFLKNKAAPKVADHLSLETIAYDPRCEEFSGADLASLVRKASEIATDEIFRQLNGEDDDLHHTEVELTQNHFSQALDAVKPSLTKKDREYFQKYSSLCHTSTKPI